VHINEDVVTIVLRDTLTKGERTSSPMSSTSSWLTMRGFRRKSGHEPAVRQDDACAAAALGSSPRLRSSISEPGAGAGRQHAVDPLAFRPHAATGVSTPAGRPRMSVSATARTSASAILSGCWPRESRMPRRASIELLRSWSRARAHDRERRSTSDKAIDADGNVTYEHDEAQTVSLLSLGVTPTFYQFSQASVEVALDIKIVEQLEASGEGRRLGFSPKPRIRARAKARSRRAGAFGADGDARSGADAAAAGAEPHDHDAGTVARPIAPTWRVPRGADRSLADAQESLADDALRSHPWWRSRRLNSR
jgi:hypothetical protein